MSLLPKFLTRISSKLLLSPQRLAAIESLDPSHIYVENVRALFGISTGLAKRFCELAVRQGVLQRRVEVRCPDQSVPVVAEAREKLPPTVECMEEVNGEPVVKTYETKRLRTSEFYVLSEAGRSRW